MSPATTEQSTSFKDPDVFIMEDDDDVREALRESLEDEGYRVATASNGKEGMAKLCDIGRPCLILLDLMMPVMSGWEVLEALRVTEHAEVPVVVVSASVTSAGDERLPLMMTKPVNLNTLLDVIRRYCG